LQHYTNGAATASAALNPLPARQAMQHADSKPDTGDSAVEKTAVHAPPPNRASSPQIPGLDTTLNTVAYNKNVRLRQRARRVIHHNTVKKMSTQNAFSCCTTETVTKREKRVI
jgi:hypothetical protein